MDFPMPDRRRDEPIQEADPLLLHVGKTILDNVAVLLFGSLLLLAAAWPGLFLATGASWAIAWPLLVLCTGPVWAGIVAAADRLLDGNAVSVRGLLGLVRNQARAGLAIAVVPAVVGGILLGSLQLLDQTPDARWLAVPLLLDAGVALVVATSLVSIFTLAASRALAGIDLWLASAQVTIGRPVTVAGTVTLFGIVAWLALMVGPVALVLVGPLAVLGAAVTRDALPDAAE
jgi:hypothetical protein